MLFALSPSELVTNRNNILSSDGSLSFIHSQLENEQKRSVMVRSLSGMSTKTEFSRAGNRCETFVFMDDLERGIGDSD